MKRISRGDPLIEERRAFIRGVFSGAGIVGLKSLVSGLPISFLTERALASGLPTALIMTSRRAGCPVNNNVPGTYVNGVDHDPRLPGVAFNLGNKVVTGAQPWARLPEALRDRLHFVHHMTNVNAHTEVNQVMELNGRALRASGFGAEMLPSVVAEELSRPLRTLRSTPFVASSGMQFGVLQNGAPINEIRPTGLRSLTGGSSNLETPALLSLRDQMVDEMYRELKSNGTPAQKRFFDSYVKSRSESRVVGDNLGTLLSDVSGDSLNDIIISVVAVVASQTSPVSVFGIPFGGDNHGDSNLDQEVAQTTSGVAAIGQLWDRLTSLGMQDRVTFAQLNVFGRTLRRNRGGGRDHNRNHSVLVTFGPNVMPGVSGGIKTTTNSFGGEALGINSRDGSVTNPDITANDTLAAVGRTVMALCGVDEPRISARIPAGKVIRSVVKS